MDDDDDSDDGFYDTDTVDRFVIAPGVATPCKFSHAPSKRHVASDAVSHHGRPLIVRIPHCHYPHRLTLTVSSCASATLGLPKAVHAFVFFSYEEVSLVHA